MTQPTYRRLMAQWQQDATKLFDIIGMAACKNEHPYIFDAENTNDPYQVRAAKGICADCPVREQCLDMALKAEGADPLAGRATIVGGLTPAERYREAVRRGYVRGAA